jgi:hypothetical protein
MPEGVAVEVRPLLALLLGSFRALSDVAVFAELSLAFSVTVA